MSMVRFFRSLQTWWFALHNRLWPPTPQEQTRANLNKLSQNLARRFDRLVRRRRLVERLRARVTKLESKIIHLIARVAGIYPSNEKRAWRLALALERLRGLTNQTRQRLQHHEKVYDGQRIRFEQKKRRLQQMQVELLMGKTSPR